MGLNISPTKWGIPILLQPITDKCIYKRHRGLGFGCNSMVITVTIHYSHRQDRVQITAIIVLSLCNRYSCYSLGQILYYYQLITHFNPCTIRAATVLLRVLVQPNSTRCRLCYAQGGKVIGHVVVVIVVNTKITIFWDLGTWATRYHNESVELGKKLASVCHRSHTYGQSLLPMHNAYRHVLSTHAPN